ncbi:glycosyltransferase family 2 protein [Fictibacillus aquaticus]|uniref:Glycosyl transferase family 2 n=1 Tax=Fictibacillus aquaticus TaxID=2021314 RepID=A0A235F8Z4_9BACL|nr:glycosyltransferase family 2 protein [Fictibacillus aquaticus]OYD57748.1 glycosyl transferase family 2 [Fictibacillus aquaticus]
MKSNVLVIIPAYNEEDVIFETLSKLQCSSPFDYIVINDGSTDRTRTILSENHFPHINLPVNMGIGGAMQTGYQYALEKGYEYAIQLDADGQHNSDELTLLYEEIRKGDADMVIGSRFVEQTGYKGSSMRRIGIYYFQWVIKFLARIKVTDPTSGYRIVNRKVIAEFAHSYPVDYPEVEVLVRLAQKNYTIKEIKVNMNARMGGKSSITPIKSAYYMLKVTFISVIRSIL